MTVMRLFIQLRKPSVFSQISAGFGPQPIRQRFGLAILN